MELPGIFYLKTKVMENKENTEMEEEAVVCDPVTKPTGMPPAGYSNLSYVKCDAATKEWYWFDPTVA